MVDLEQPHSCVCGIELALYLHWGAYLRPTESTLHVRYSQFLKRNPRLSVYAFSHGKSRLFAGVRTPAENRLCLGWVERLAEQFFFHQLTQNMADEDMNFLNSGGVL